MGLLKAEFVYSASNLLNVMCWCQTNVVNAVCYLSKVLIIVDYSYVPVCM